MNMKRVLTLLLAALLCVGALAACTSNAPQSSSQDPSTSQEADPSATDSPDATSSDAGEDAGEQTELPEKLIVGLDASFPPMGFTDEANNLIGADLDMAQEVCKRLGIEYEAKPIEWSAKDLELNGDKIHVIWNGMTITEERLASYEVSRPYMKNLQVVVVAEGSEVKTKADLAGKAVAAQTDSSGESALMKDEAFYATLKDGKHVQYADYVTAMNDLELGRIDAIVMDSVVAKYMISENQKKLVLLEENMGEEEYGFAVKKGNTALLEAIESALDEMQADGTIAAISEKWFGTADEIVIG